ncbi:DUF2808 domain-containing protein [Pseudanabaenaceae cyanobacterium LEGE 13415]|nr:DUF2808 domain-containing protein [Pseudanabaenaceae cyanobacterium LEGE 13415]
MNDTLYQMQTVITLAIASTIVTATSVANSPAPLTLTLPQVTKESSAKVNGASYAFTMTLPKRSGSRFTKLSFSLTNADQTVPLPLDLKNTIAQSGKNAIALKRTFIDETGTLWVEFDSPLPENTTLTVIFKAREPLSSGRYRYSIAAYPIGASPQFVDDGTFAAK